MAEKKTPAVSPATESAADPKTRKTAAKAPARRGRPPLAPELYVELNGKQYNITDVIDRAKADYRATHKVGVQSCKVYVKPEEGTAYYVINKCTCPCTTQAGWYSSSSPLKHTKPLWARSVPSFRPLAGA